MAVGLSRPRERSAVGFGRKLGAVALFGVALRALLVVTVTRFDNLGFDASYYNLLAVALAHGHGFVDPFALYIGHRVRPTALYPPAYPVFMALFAPLGAGSRQWHLLIGCGLGGVSIVLCGCLARHFVSERSSLGVAAIASVYPMMVGADVTGMSETLYLPLVLGTLLVAMRCTGRRARPWALLGLTIGLSALTRDEGLAYLLVLVVPLAVVSDATARRKAALVGLTAACALAVLAPWVIRNDVTFGDALLISNSSSTTVGGANCAATYYGSGLGSWSYPCLGNHRPGAEQMSETQLNDDIRRQGLAYMDGHVSRLPLVVLFRLLRTYGLHNASGYVRPLKTWFTLGWLMYLVLVPLAALGTVEVVRRRGDFRSRELVALMAPVAAVTLVTVASYGNQRFRVAAEPVLLVLAVMGAGRLHALVRGRPSATPAHA